MPIPDDIHHSIADADDMEAVWDKQIDVWGVFKNLLRHPAQIIGQHVCCRLYLVDRVDAFAPRCA